MGDDRGGASQTRQHVLGTGRAGCKLPWIAKKQKLLVLAAFFRWQVPKYDPQAAAGVHSLGKLVRASVARQNKLLAFSSNHAVGNTRAPGVADKIGVQFGVAHSQLSLLIGESAKALDAVRKAAN